MKNPGAYNAMLAIAPALIFVPLMSSYRGYFQGRKEMSKIAISQISEQLFRVVLGIGLAYLNAKCRTRKAAGAIMGATIGAVASIIFNICIYWEEKRKIDIK